jgi:hypothetical protein
MTGPSAEQNNRTGMIRACVDAVAALPRPLKDRSWKFRAGIGAATAVVIAGFGLALLALLNSPTVSVSSGAAPVQVHLGGVGTEVTGIRATSVGRPLALARRGTAYVPVATLPQGRTVRVRVTAAPPVLAALAAGLRGLDVGDAAGALGGAVGAGGSGRAPGSGDARLRPPGKRHRLPRGRRAGQGRPAWSALDHGPAGRAGAPVGRRASGGGCGMAVGASGRAVHHGGLARGAAGRHAGRGSGSGSGQCARRARQSDHPDVRRAGGQRPRCGPPAGLAGYGGNLDRAGCRHAGVHTAGPGLRTRHRGNGVI